MTEAEKLLQETKSAVVAETQTEDICVIDSDLRIIGIPEQFKVLGVENDKDVKVMQFRIPKTYKGTDLSAFTISVNYQNARGTKGRYVVTDKKVSGDQIEFSWTVGKTAIEYRGDTRFIVCMRLTGSDGIIQKEFNTTLATMTVLEGLEVDNPVIEQEEKDIIAQLLQIVDDKSKEAVQAVTEEGTKQIKAVQAAAQEIIADREQIQTNKADIADLRQAKAGAIINSAKGDRIAVRDSAEAFFEGLKLYGKSEQVQTNGYQLFDASKLRSASAFGAIVTNNGDGSFTVTGSGNLTGGFNVSHDYTHDETLKLLKTGTITINRDQDTYPFPVFQLVNGQEGYYIILNKTTLSGTITQEMLDNKNSFMRLLIIGNNGTPIVPGTVKPMLYQSGDGTWEPFTGGKPSPSMEYPQDPESSGDGGEISVNVGEKNTQHLSIQTPNGLLGLPVDSGGNYTDSNGQQWVCDEMDFKRGKYVQRIERVTFNGSEGWYVQNDNTGQHKFFISLKDALYPYNAGDFDKTFICDHFKSVNKTGDIDDGTVRKGVYKDTFAPVFKPYGAINEIRKFTSWLSENPTTILYILATPIETNITEETMTAYRKLYTNYPSTVIQNDAGAGMEVEYVADTKQFILDQIKTLVQT